MQLPAPGNRVRLALLCILLAGLWACKTVEIPESPRIPIPPNLPAEGVKIAILAAITNRPPPPEIDRELYGQGEAFDKMVWSWFKDERRARRRGWRGWYPESFGPSVIYAGLSVRSHYLRIAIRYDDAWVWTEIVESRNLRQSEGRIHKKAIAWIRRLEDNIRRELGRQGFGHEAIP